jgi:hypothetical protein
MNLPRVVGNMRFDPRNRGCSAADRTHFVSGSDRILLVVVWSTHEQLHSSDMFRRVRGRARGASKDTVIQLTTEQPYEKLYLFYG